MLLHTYQVFSSLEGDLHFYVHFFFNFMEYFFFGHPIYTAEIFWLSSTPQHPVVVDLAHEHAQ